MLTLEQMIALHRIFSGEPPSPRSKAPTEASISRINSTLGIILPESFIEFARRCPAYYRVLFPSIGEDFDEGYHILNINRLFHEKDPPHVPSWLTVINHGHDEDCYGFDSRQHSGNEYLIVYWDAAGGLEFDNSSWQVFNSFNNYLEVMITYYAKAADKERAEQIIRAA